MFKSGFIKLNKTVQPEVKKPKESNDRGVVYLGHVPHGFYENEMKQYFSQFGDVTNINIPKSKKTGKARGFAFVEFLYPEVAKVVAETMNNYLMHKKILVAKYLAPDEVKSNTFWRCNKNNIPLTIKNRSIQRKAMEKPLNPKQEKQKKSSLNYHMQLVQKKLKSKGIEYDIQTYSPGSSVDNTKNTTVPSEVKDDDNTLLAKNNKLNSANGEKKTLKTLSKLTKNKKNKRLQ